MNETLRQCPQCNAQLPPNAPQGLCPRCLLNAAAPPPEAIPGDIIDIGDAAEVAKALPQFEIIELLGQGGMGVVYKARQIVLDRVVALKILPPGDAFSPDFVERFRREARALAKLNHPNIVNVYDFGETGGLYYIIMEFVDGANLRQLFQTRKLTSAEALAIVPTICDALQYAHEEGLVHRDIKPENLLIDKKGRVKIADFGLAKLLRREPLDMTLTLSGTALGTLRYMAPEQMDKPETVDHRADLYSLGVVIYEMLTGETPVGRFELPSQKAQVDVRFDEIVLHALEREPDRRYQHASQVREDVERVTGKPQVAPASSSPAPATQPEPVNHLNNFLGFFMTPQPGYAKQVGKPMLILTGLWMIAMLVITFSVPQGKQDVHLITMLAGLVGVPLGLLILSLRWAVLRGKAVEPADKSAGAAAATPAVGQKAGAPVTAAEFRQQDAREILGTVMAILLGLSTVGVIAGAIGLARVLFPALRTDMDIGPLASLGHDAFQFGSILVLSLMALFLLPKARRQGRDRLARINAANLVIVGSLLTFAGDRHWFGLAVPYWVGGIYSLAAAVCWLILRGKDVSAALRTGAGAAPNAPQSPRHLLSAFLVLLCLFGFFFGFSFQAKHSGSAAGLTKIITVGALDPLFTSESGPSGFQTGINFFSWSFFAVVVAGIAFGALWRIGREDQGKVPRDAAWWRNWWKQVGIWGGLLLIVCIVRTVMHPEKVLQPPGDRTVQSRFNSPPQAVTYLDGHTSTVKALAVSQDGRTLASVGFDGRLIVRDLPGGKVINTITAPMDDKQAGPAGLMSVAISPDKEHVFASGNRLLQARLRADKVAKTIASSNGSITRITPFDGGRKLAYIGAGGTEIVFFDLAAQRQLKTAPIFPGKFFGNVRTSAASPDGRFIAVTSSDMKSDPGGGASSAEPCKLTVFDTEGVERVSWQFADFADFSFATVVFPDARSLAVCLPSGKMLRWTLDAGEQWQASPDPVRISPGRYTASAASRDGRVIWLAENRQIVGIDAATGKGVAFVDLHIGERLGNFSAFPIEAIAATNEPNTIAAALWDGRVALAKCHPMATDATKPEAAPANDLRFSIQQDRSQIPATATPGRQDFAFKFSGPTDHTLNVWLEVWRDGKLEIVDGFDFLARPKVGAPLEAALRLTTMNGDVASVESKGKVRYDWIMRCGGPNGTGETNGAWRPNIFKELGSINSTWDYPPKGGWHPRPGETVTILAMVGYRLTSLSEFVPGWSEAELLKGWPNSAVLIRARFNPARAGELGDGPGLGGNVTDREYVTAKLAQFALGKQLAVDLRGHRSVTEAHAALVAAASTPEGRERAVQMVKEFNTGGMTYSTSLAPVIDPVSELKYRIETASAEEIVSTLEKFITDLTNLPRGSAVTWHQPRPFEKGPNGPQLTANTVRKLKLPQRQAEEANKLMQKYAGEAHSLERRHTKIAKNEKGHVLVTIEPFSDECLELARKMVAELGGIVPQDILPAIRPGALPEEIFRTAGECRHMIELWKEEGKYFLNHR